MKTIIAIASLLALPLITQAQQLNVIQVKGNRAIVEVQDGNTLSVGQTIHAGNGSSSAGKGSRNKLIGLDVAFANTKPNIAGSASTMSFTATGKYGWNHKDFEFGPVASLNYIKESGKDATTAFGLGAFGTYNFQPNISGTSTIFSLDAEGLFTQQKTTGTSSSGMAFSAGPFMKWFGVSDDHAIRAGVVYSMEKSKVGNLDVTTSGFKAVAGISTYF